MRRQVAKDEVKEKIKARSFKICSVCLYLEWNGLQLEGSEQETWSVWLNIFEISLWMLYWNRLRRVRVKTDQPGDCCNSQVKGDGGLYQGGSRDQERSDQILYIFWRPHEISLLFKCGVDCKRKRRVEENSKNLGLSTRRMQLLLNEMGEIEGRAVLGWREY